MRKLILQIRHTIFSRSLCVRHLQTIFPYSPYLHGVFTIYSNCTPHTRIYFCKAENLLLNWNLLFQFTKRRVGKFVVNSFPFEIIVMKSAARRMTRDFRAALFHLKAARGSRPETEVNGFAGNGARTASASGGRPGRYYRFSAL